MQKVLIIGYVWPEPASSAAGRHMLEIIHCFLEADWQVTFATACGESEHRFDLTELGVLEQTIALNSDSFDHWVSDLEPAVVIFDRFMVEEQFSWRVAKNCPQAMRLLDTEDLHFLRAARQAKPGSELSPVDLKNETAVREIASILRSDLSLIISEKEMDLLESVFKIDQDILHYLPFLSSQFSDSKVGFNDREGFAFVGTMRHAPNLDAVRYMKQQLWPRVRQQLPGVNLYIAGSYMTREVTQMHKPADGFHIIGKVACIEDFLKDKRVFLSPLRFGAGLKGKLIEAMENSLPSITTMVGAEGIAGDLPWPGAVADNLEQMARHAVDIHQNKGLWEKHRQHTKVILRERFSTEEHSQNLLKRINETVSSLQLHRNNNFLGQMLQHHTLKSTEYMSRWIECKNKKRDNT